MKQWLSFCAASLAALPVIACATWSVVAVDPQTGEVGAAGATCWPGVAIIARIVPGKGAVVAQGLTSVEGRDHASKMLREGSAANEVIEAITSSRVDESVAFVRHLRQYGVVALHDGIPSTASFTGHLTSNVRGVRKSAGVSVQGNMLASADVLDKTLEHYLNTPKSCGLAVALLNALEAGALEGGDARCSIEQGALSAFLFVAKPNDAATALTVRIIAPDQQPGGKNPVLMLRQPLRTRLSEKAILPEGCSL
jgi:uncharacterized Ntn-hydrolase superfamily protein